MSSYVLISSRHVSVRKPTQTSYVIFVNYRIVGLAKVDRWIKSLVYVSILGYVIHRNGLTTTSVQKS